MYRRALTVVRRDGARSPASMNLKRYARGPALYIVLGLILVLAVTNGLRGNGGYKSSNTATVRAAT